MKTNLFFKIVLFAGLPSVLWAGREPIVALWGWFSDQEAVTTSIDRLGVWGPVLLFLLFVLQVFFAFIPGQALMIACGFLYGFTGGFLLSWLSLVAGGEMAFMLARRYGRLFAEKWISPEVLSLWDQTAQGQGIGFFALSLVMPLVPNDAMCYVAGLGKISHRHFSVANLLGRGMACLFTSAIGAFGGSLPWQVWAILVAILIGGGLAWLVARNRKSSLLMA
ncbi:MAG TPA: VTT domain-containing protein [Anaerolineales bacterium]|nr:VTT domain-containing protein [Anaerolineales bacterium]